VGGAALDAELARGDEHAELCLRLTRAAIVGGRWEQAREYVHRAGRRGDPRSLALEAEAAYGSGDADRAAELAAAVIDRVDSDDSGNHAGLATSPGGNGTADPAGNPRTDPRPGDRAAILCQALMVRARSDRGADPALATDLLRRVVQVASEHGLTQWRTEAVFALGSFEHSGGDPDEPSLVAARELAERTGLLSYAVQADLLRSDTALQVDGPAAALPQARRTAEQAERLGLTALQAMAEVFTAAAAALLGDHATTTAMLAAATARADAPVEVRALTPVVRALPHLARYDLPRASALVDRGIPMMFGHGSAVPIEYVGLWALLRTAVADRDQEAREVLRGHYTGRAAANRAALAYADAIAIGRAGSPAEAAARFAAAEQLITGLPWWQRLLRLPALEAAVADGWGDPVPALRVDLAAHEQAGQPGWARTCRDLLRAAGAPTRRRGGPPVPPELRARGVTSREAEVLALVADGLTNAQTAERLFLSPRTVDTHVARLLAKTGAADRSGLRRWTTGEARDE
ncbi:MAG TPA: helix-turn-helix transcriptional regulator, partial [Pseudonocardia sp.]|nr:helix-turn-helix transcriptional regulator [Pseudonocardia sp.]